MLFRSVKTRDVDTAKVVITAWINSKIKERIEKENEECKELNQVDLIAGFRNEERVMRRSQTVLTICFY